MKRIFLLVAMTLGLLSCKQEENKIVKKESKQLNIDTLSISNDNIDFLEELQEICVEDDGVFKNCDELFSKDGASLFFIMIPKAGAKKWFDIETKNLKGEVFEINNKLTDKIKRMRKEDLSKEFDIWVYYTDKKYTEYVGMDSPYNFKSPRITDLYFLKSGKNDWQKLQSFKINNDKDETKENEWRIAFIDNIIRKSNENNLASNKNILSSKWIGKYSTYFSYGKIGGNNAGWLLELEIKNNEIKATGEGFQIGFSDLLSATENGNKLILNHLKNKSGYKLGQKMNPEFTLIEENGKFYIKSDWIDKDIITKLKKFGYEIAKE